MREIVFSAKLCRTVRAEDPKEQLVLLFRRVATGLLERRAITLGEFQNLPPGSPHPLTSPAKMRRASGRKLAGLSSHRHASSSPCA
jgi:hypothetical protein